MSLTPSLCVLFQREGGRGLQTEDRKDARSEEEEEEAFRSCSLLPRYSFFLAPVLPCPSPSVENLSAEEREEVWKRKRNKRSSEIGIASGPDRDTMQRACRSVAFFHRKRESQTRRQCCGGSAYGDASKTRRVSLEGLDLFCFRFPPRVFTRRRRWFSGQQARRLFEKELRRREATD